jgi:hypothetical protein
MRKEIQMTKIKAMMKMISSEIFSKKYLMMRMNTSKKNVTRNLKKENLHKLLQKNWNNMLK